MGWCYFAPSPQTSGAPDEFTKVKQRSIAWKIYRAKPNFVDLGVIADVTSQVKVKMLAICYVWFVTH